MKLVAKGLTNQDIADFLDAIRNNPESPTFENTLEALEMAGLPTKPEETTNLQNVRSEC